MLLLLAFREGFRGREKRILRRRKSCVLEKEKKVRRKEKMRKYRGGLL